MDHKATIPNQRAGTWLVRQVGPEKSRTLRFIGTDETPDRYNTIFTRDGWDFGEFRKNPVFLFHHNHDGSTPTLPIGRVVNIEKSGDSGRAGWAFDVEFASRDLYPFADLVYNMYREGFMNAVSVGFIVKQRRAVTDADEQKRLGFQPGYAEVFERIELTELSAVPVPGNQNALIQRMRSFVPEHLRATIHNDTKQELDAAWLGDQLTRLHAALELDKQTRDAAPPVLLDTPLGEAPTPAEVSAALAAPAPVEPAPAPAREPETSFEQRTLETFEAILTELRALRQDVQRSQVPPAPPAAAPVAPAPVPTPVHKTGQAATHGRDVMELMLDENLAALRRTALGTKLK